MLALLAATFLFDVPLGPGLEGRAAELVAPYGHMRPIDDTGWELRHLRVGAREITYVVSRANEKPQVNVILRLDAVVDGDLEESVEVVAATDSTNPTPEARTAGDRLRDALMTRLKAGDVKVRQRGPPPEVTRPAPKGGEKRSAGATTAPPSFEVEDLPDGMPEWLSRLLIWCLGLSVIGSLPSALRHTLEGRLKALAAPTIVLVVATAMLFALDDMVLHANGHGWDTVRVVSGADNAPFYRPFGLYNRYGPFHVDLPAALGALGAPGHETFLASRLSAILMAGLLWAVGMTLFPRTNIPLIAVGFLVTSPVFLAVGRAETVTATGMGLMLLTLWLSVLAGRQRSYALLVAAGVALTCLASFRLMGPLLAPFAGIALLGRASGQAPEVPHWRPKAIGVILLAIGVSSPHLIQMAVMMTADMSVRAGTSVIPPSILDSPLWVPSALVWASALGVAVLTLERGWVALLLVGWAMVGLFAPSSSAAFFQDHARYQAWLIPSACLLAACALDAMGRRLWVFGPVLVAVYLAWLGQGSWLPGQALAHPTAEDAQLRALRVMAAHVPESSVVAMPTRTRSRARTSLPDVELAASRPDVEWVPLKVALQRSADLRDRPHLWMETLPCSARYPGENGQMAVDCTLAQESLQMQPLFTWMIEPELPPELEEVMEQLNTELQPTRGDTTQWNPRPFWRAPYIRLHRITGW